MSRSVPTLDKPLYRISEAVELLPYSRSKLYELIRAGRLRTVKEGAARLIPAPAIAEYVALLEREAEVSPR
jgi:excisionase family DNA binding protein